MRAGQRMGHVAAPNGLAARYPPPPVRGSLKTERQPEEVPDDSRSHGNPLADARARRST